MKKSRYTAEQVVFTFRQAGEGAPVGEICRKMGIPLAHYHPRKVWLLMGSHNLL